MKITLEVSDKNEATASPYWLIIDPAQNFETGERGIRLIASMITGPFFSREEAETVLRIKRHRFSSNACVYCHSAYQTLQYHEAYRKAERGLNVP